MVRTLKGQLRSTINIFRARLSDDEYKEMIDLILTVGAIIILACAALAGVYGFSVTLAGIK